MEDKRLRQRTGTVAVGAMAIIAVLMIVLTCIGIVVVELNQYNISVKYANEAVATKTRESLAVVQTSNTLVNVINEGSTPVVIIGFFRVNPADNNPNYVPLSNSATVPLLSSASITLPQATPENWKVGVVTSLGNVFWEEAVFSSRSWLTGWSYRRPITITGTLNLSNYQILVQVDTASLISAGKMRSDGGDIRFTDSDGVTLLNYWIEPGTINTANTRIWVKVPSIPSGTKTAYVYYGNPSATSQSNGDNTFLLFDDFLGTTLNTSKWNVNYYANPSYGGGTASYSVANGELVLYAPYESYRAIIVSSVQTFGQSEIRMKVYPSAFATYNNVYLWGAVYSIPTSGIGGHLWDKGYAWDVDDYNHHRFEYYSSSLSYANAFIDTNYHVYFAKYIPSSQIVEGYDTTTENTLTTNIPNTANKVFFECGTTTWYSNTNQYLHVDWVFVKNYASSEPSVVLGSEET